MESALPVSPKAVIYSEDVDALVGKDMSGWVAGEGPIESYYEAIIHDNGRKFTITSKKWKGEDDIRIGADQVLKTTSFGSGFVLEGFSQEEEDGKTFIRLYGGIGQYMRLQVVDRPAIAKSSSWHPWNWALLKTEEEDYVKEEEREQNEVHR